MLELLTIITFLVITSVTYHHVGWTNLKKCYSHWLQPGYWTNYNIVEAVSWLAKAAVIVPGLVWNLEIWWLHFITLVTSVALIWVSERKLLPTLVAFNTLWIAISSIVIVRNIYGMI
jgi:hypothetical protein